MSTKFTYKNLTATDSIRLLLLQPSAGSDDNEIQCKLLHTSLSECEDNLTFQYIALSYVWGDETIQGKIFVDGTEFHVTINLFRALRSIRHESKELPLWVDALCINQKDMKERAQQVRFMGSIYASARNTIIYLGESDVESDRALEALKDTTFSVSSPGSYEYNQTIRSCIVSSILSRTWFSRVWVLQELALSQNPIIQCGQSRVNWKRLAKVLSILEEDMDQRSATTDNTLPEAEQLMMDMQEAREKIQIGNINIKLVEKHQTLLDLVISRSGLGAKDPRDIIYAHIGMVNYISGHQVDFRASSRAGTNSSLRKANKDKELIAHLLQMDLPSAPTPTTSQIPSEWVGQDIIIDYQKTVAEVYNEFAQRAIQNSNDLSVTLHIQSTYSQPRLPGLASWAPDWTLRSRQEIVPVDHDFHGSLGSDWIPPLSPLAGLKTHTIFVKKRSVLGVLGQTLACIRALSKVIESVVDSHDLSLQVETSSDTRQHSEWETRAYNGQTGGRATEKQIMLYRNIYERWRKQLGPEVLIPLEERNLNDYRTSYTTGDHDLRKDDITKHSNIRWALGTDKWLGYEIRASDYLVKASRDPRNSIVHGRRVALLDKGVLAFVPAGAEKGDVLCSVNIHSHPVVLRSHDAANEAVSLDSSLRSYFASALKLQPDSKTSGLRQQQINADVIRHYTLIGDCFLDKEKAFYGLEEHPIKHVPKIFALH